MNSFFKSLCLLVLYTILSASSENNENKEFLSFLDDEWNYKLSQSPVYATRMGVKGYETEWRDNSLETIKNRVAHSKGILESLKEFNVENLSEVNQLNLRLFTQLTLNDLEISKLSQS